MKFLPNISYLVIIDNYIPKQNFIPIKRHYCSGLIFHLAKVYYISSLNIVFHSLSKYLFSHNIYTYIYIIYSLQFVGHCNFRYQVSFLTYPYTYYHESGARYIKKHGAIIRAIRNANIRFTGEVHQSEVFPTLVPPFSPRFTYLCRSIFPNVCVCEWKVRAKILHFVAKQPVQSFYSEKKEL